MVALQEVSNMFWGVTIDGGKKYTQTVEHGFHISMAALEHSSSKGPVSVMIQHEKAEFLLCTLSEAGHCYQQPLDLNFNEGEEVTFFLNGKGVVHLTGYLVEDPQDFPYDGEEEEGDSMEELSEDDMDSEEEEVPQLKAIGANGLANLKKRKNQPEEMQSKKRKVIIQEDDEDDDDSDDDDFLDYLAVDGSDDDDDEDDEEDEDDDDEDDFDEEEDDEEDEEDDEEDISLEPPSPVKAKKVKTPAKAAEKTPAKSPEKTPTKDKKTAGKAEKTPAKGDKTPAKGDKTPAKGDKTPAKGDKTPAKGDKTPAKGDKTPAKGDQTKKTPAKNAETKTPAKDGSGDAPQELSKSAKKKLKKKNLEAETGTPSGEKKVEAAAAAPKTPRKRVLEGGVMVEELKDGHGPDAKKGKMIQVYYTGKLQSGKIFDMLNNGKPFKFRLGQQEVIRGWDIGVAGMKVGGKRKITVPPKLGYGSQSVGKIPPNSTLTFEVELKSVS